MSPFMLQLSNDLAAGQAQAEGDQLPVSRAADPPDVIDIPSDDEDDTNKVEAAPYQPPQAAVASYALYGG